MFTDESSIRDVVEYRDAALGEHHLKSIISCMRIRAALTSLIGREGTDDLR